MEEYLILVDEFDRPCGKQEKLLTHQLGLLHRAFSVFIFNTSGELLMQKRAETKYHSANLWTNTCCSHPHYNENLKSAVDRRLYQEMGMKCKTDFAFSFIYKASFDNGLTEHEYDHVYFGQTDELPVPDPAEVSEWKYMNLNKLESDIRLYPEKYTEWLKICLPKVKIHFADYFKNKA